MLVTLKMTCTAAAGLSVFQTCLMMRPAQDYFCSWSEHVLPGTSWTMTIRIYLHSSSCPTLLRTYKSLQGYSLRDPIRKVSATATATATAKATATARATAPSSISSNSNRNFPKRISSQSGRQPVWQGYFLNIFNYY